MKHAAFELQQSATWAVFKRTYTRFAVETAKRVARMGKVGIVCRDRGSRRIPSHEVSLVNRNLTARGAFQLP
jgi:hypothetical protein